MPVEVGFCDQCFDLVCEDEEECEANRRQEQLEAALEDEEDR